MIINSDIPFRIQAYIKERLYELEQNNNIKILFAVESGSRAWGFPSQDSDYDIRFVYLRNFEDYLSVMPLKDIIEIPITYDSFLKSSLDIVGWDIKKTLQLSMKSNITLSEWITSPVRYIDSDAEKSKMLFEFIFQESDLEILAYRYQNWARNIWEENRDNTQHIKIKSYCYVLRLLLCYQYIKELQTIPPMDMSSLINFLKLTRSFNKEIEMLISFKANSNEGDFVKNNYDILDKFITLSLKEKIEKKKIAPYNEKLIKKANSIFKKLVCTATQT